MRNVSAPPGGQWDEGRLGPAASWTAGQSGSGSGSRSSARTWIQINQDSRIHISDQFLQLHSLCIETTMKI